MQHEIFFAIDEHGNSAVSLEALEDAIEAVKEFDGSAVRASRIVVQMEPPEVPDVEVIHENGDEAEDPSEGEKDAEELAA
jgi:hypothetical protein